MQTSSTYSVIFLSIIMQGMSQKLFMYENVHVQADNNNASLKKNQRAYKLLIIKWLLLPQTYKKI